MSEPTQERARSRSGAAFAEEERQGMMLAAKVRTVSLALVLLWQAIDSPETGLSYFFVLLEIFTFVLLGGLQYIAAYSRLGGRSIQYVFVTLDCILLAVVFSLSVPFSGASLPPAISMDTARFLYFLMFLMQASFSFRPFLVVWCGISIMIARIGMWVWFLSLPGTYSNLDLPEQTVEAWLAGGTDLNFLFLGYAATELLVVVILSAGLAVVVARSRRLVNNLLSTERKRASLARYFSPNVVDQLSKSDVGLSAAKHQKVAVLFADIIGFTKLCENATADEVIELLRGYHDRLGKAVFENSGTLDKYIGDGLMATFGTPSPGPHDPENALNSAYEMIAALGEWNTERVLSGDDPIRVGIGLHWGIVVAGDIGNERRLEYSVVGDTVNIASRIEHLTRQLNTQLVVSDDLVSAIKQNDPNANLDRLIDAGLQKIRGRTSEVKVWIYSQ
ncbi:adenylate/guanylate cyclase domain-containing protein [Ruegeria profundi]|uniref:adenylate/guanylate cyclase domain-containing protein n=1 Tax=Ruegeria profundi TaxID=1685378 RepID=UPI001CD3B61C|nr:adenylate/guanylate cyclase domain-containing protein [Ruegeria profundi]MCA0928837.1 adenylate/guanylate cyclase domain-containing protein [Ruegeria profundi]